MTTAQATCPDLSLTRGRDDTRAPARADLLSLARGFVARWSAGWESYDDYFAEMERALPPHVRERRRAEREGSRLALVAALCR
jgi:predicted N-acyltransferase